MGRKTTRRFRTWIKINPESLLQKYFNVIPAKAGIQVFQGLLNLGCHRGDGFVEFCERLLILTDFGFFSVSKIRWRVSRGDSLARKEA
jgi:hypothetical protein